MMQSARLPKLYVYYVKAIIMRIFFASKIFKVNLKLGGKMFNFEEFESFKIKNFEYYSKEFWLVGGNRNLSVKQAYYYTPTILRSRM